VGENTSSRTARSSRWPNSTITDEGILIISPLEDPSLQGKINVGKKREPASSLFSFIEYTNAVYNIFGGEIIYNARLASGLPVVRVPMKMHDREDVDAIGLNAV
jgi:hypothetical protein